MDFVGFVELGLTSAERDIEGANLARLASTTWAASIVSETPSIPMMTRVGERLKLFPKEAVIQLGG